MLDLEPSPAATASYVCDARQHCSQMRSCAEATYFRKNYANTKMDGDNDGMFATTSYADKQPVRHNLLSRL